MTTKRISLYLILLFKIEIDSRIVSPHDCDCVCPDRQEKCEAAEPCTQLSLISRDAWGGPNIINARKMLLPVHYVFVHHSGDEPCYNVESCARRVRFIYQCLTAAEGWTDIAYNFLIGGDGNVYEGVGWSHIGTHTFGWNSRSLGVAFMGTYHHSHPPENMKQAFLALMRYGVAYGKIHHKYGLYAHSDGACTAGPGKGFYQALDTWPHWHRRGIIKQFCGTKPPGVKFVTMYNRTLQHLNIMRCAQRRLEESESTGQSVPNGVSPPPQQLGAQPPLGPFVATSAWIPAGAPPAYVPAGAPPAYVPAGAPPASVPAGSPPASAPAGAPPASAPAGAAPNSAPAGAPSASAPAGAPPASAPAGAPLASAPAGAAPASVPAGAQNPPASYSVM